MNKIMKTTPMLALLERIFGEYAAKKTMYEIPEYCVDKMKTLVRESPGFTVNKSGVSIPAGLAAGPHTQIAPNLVAGWLCGARVFELKTIQVNDRLDIEKPCIDAVDEGHNVEWSTELLVEEAMEEYLRGWVAIKALSALMGLPADDTLFNISAGYTLEGIKSAKVDGFIEGMRNPWNLPVMKSIIQDTLTGIEASSCKALFGEQARKAARDLVASLKGSPVHSMTLSTMHGCPPDEIEKIGRYLLMEKHLPTYIKLNPTLLGFLKVRSILNKLGWTSIELKRDTFEHDLQFEDAVRLIENLRSTADREGLYFGIKLSNTLANVNNGARLPGAERYMSGRALFPITVRLASELVDTVPGINALSFCGGVSYFNARSCIEAGLGPLTVATDILKPGGYQRMLAIAEETVRGLKEEHALKPDPERLHLLADSVFNKPYYLASFKKGTTHIQKKLPLTDCFAAPCIEACPAGQKAPEYIRALSAGNAETGLKIIYKDNPLPNITGILCDHQCMSACSRNDYEGPVEIREIKHRCALQAHIPAKSKVPVIGKGKTAVVGSGPAGLACAHYLALNGYPVTVFEKGPHIGGIPSGIIPKFRITKESLQKDIDRIHALGAVFITESEPSYEELKAQGFTSIVLACGAGVSKPFTVKNCTIPVITALELLGTLHMEREKTRGFMEQHQNATSIVVVGGGNTAMDAARIAARLPWRPQVYIAYRRTKDEMPADREELEAAFSDGVKLLELSLPEAIMQKEKPYLVIRKMLLGKPDESGRRTPYPSDITESLPCDLLVSAIGETTDPAKLDAFKVTYDASGKPRCNPDTMMSDSNREVFVTGDARRGPSSIIAAEADGKKAALSILRTVGIDMEDTLEACAFSIPDTATIRNKRGIFLEGEDGRSGNFVNRESQRCLSCDALCLRCVESCPNRANFALPVRIEAGGPVKQDTQIIHLDALCNECGNCSFLCPYEGEPCKDKITLFDSDTELRASVNAGFAFGKGAKPELHLRAALEGGVETLTYDTWTKTATAVSAALLLAARTIHAEHKYLIQEHAE